MLDPSLRLRQAVTEGNLLVVKRLLKRFPDLLENVDPSNGWSSLHYAAYHGRYLVCVHLISLGHDKTEILRTFKRNTSVHLSLMNGHEQTTHLLLQHFPSQLNEHGDQGQTPIHVSAIKDYFKCIEMLLALGADVNAQDDEGNNALHVAMKYGALRTVKLLIQHNIDTSLKNKNGLTPLDVAASFQVEKHYHAVLSDSASISTDDAISAMSMRTALSSSAGGELQSQALRTHSNSLPPLPTVTTARRASNSSSTRSPVPRSAVSLGFSGSNSNSYIYSPANSTGTNMGSPVTLSIKPPVLAMSSSPVLYSPTGPGLITSIREEQQHQHSLNSFPSMSSLNSGKNTPSETRTRASSQTASAQVNFTPLNKSRSNSHGSRTGALAPTPSSLSSASYTNLSKPPTNNINNGPGKISPAASSISLSRSPTGSTSDHEEPLKASHTGNSSGLMSSFAEGSSDLRQKFTEKFETVSTAEYTKRGSKQSILNVPIASLSRSRKE